MSNPKKREKQLSQPKKGEPVEIPVPKRGEFFAAIEKVAPPAGRKHPAEKDRPPERSD